MVGQNIYYKKAKKFSKSVSKKTQKRVNRKASKIKGRKASKRKGRKSSKIKGRKGSKRTKRWKRKISNYHRGGVVTSPEVNHKYTIAKEGEIPGWVTGFDDTTMKYGIDYTLLKRDNGQLYLKSSEDSTEFYIGSMSYQEKPKPQKNWAKMIDLTAYARSYKPRITRSQPVEKGTENNIEIEVSYGGKLTYITYGSTLLDLLNKICDKEGIVAEEYSLIFAGRGTDKDGDKTIRELDTGAVLEEKEIEVFLRKKRK